jgi:transposase
LLHRWREEAAKAGHRIKRIAVAFEAGRDGFWLARWLRARDIEVHVIHASSVAVSREHRRVTKAIRREMRRRAAVEPVIGHLKDDHRMRRNYLKGRDGDRINAVLAAAGYNFSLLLRWFRRILCALVLILARAVFNPLRLKITLGKHSSRTTSYNRDVRI